MVVTELIKRLFRAIVFFSEIEQNIKDIFRNKLHGKYICFSGELTNVNYSVKNMKNLATRFYFVINIYLF